MVVCVVVRVLVGDVVGLDVCEVVGLVVAVVVGVVVAVDVAEVVWVVVRVVVRVDVGLVVWLVVWDVDLSMSRNTQPKIAVEGILLDVVSLIHRHAGTAWRRSSTQSQIIPHFTIRKGAAGVWTLSL